jgi:hypothetical protein
LLQAAVAVKDGLRALEVQAAEQPAAMAPHRGLQEQTVWVAELRLAEPVAFTVLVLILLPRAEHLVLVETTVL